MDVLAIDMGSSAIRAFLGHWNTAENELSLQEIYRQPIEVQVDADNHLTWPVAQFAEIAKKCAAVAAQTLGHAPDSVGVDGWGVDFVKIFASGECEPQAVAYRDTCGHIGQAALDTKITRRHQYRFTGVMPQDINSVNRLTGANAVGKAPYAGILFLQDMITRVLATADIPGWDAPVACAPWASQGVASTSAMMDVNRFEWNTEILKAAGIDPKILPPIHGEPSLLVKRGRTNVALSGSHDTACAAYCIAPNVGDIFVSCGSWAVIGAITPKPLTTDEAYEKGVTNEAATGGSNRAELNQTGLWLLQECRRQWSKEGKDVSFSQLDKQCWEAKSLGVFINPSDAELISPGEMPSRLRAKLESEFGILECSDGQLLRTIKESLAHSIVAGINDLRHLVKSEGVVHITGGGTYDTFLMQEIANLLGEPIRLAKCEASIIGNMLAQLHVLGVPKGATQKWFDTSDYTEVLQPVTL
ncbi:rhamnulokinase [Mobiluncus mulieris]|uniref:rhamnulokinase n=1 Tax=Mobiluncus mulieris TaxID=2052 RepID=UPI000CAEB903|nr:FGGY-family carbohydrate kinase [Mobiluncus mulieris]PNL43207.1 rhamnulokinase [Mobiluncus mulieris]